MSKVDLENIFPACNKLPLHHFNPTKGICGETLRELLGKQDDLPKVKTFSFQNIKVGTLIIGGYIKDLSFENTQVDRRANKCDCLAIWCGLDLSYPKENYDDDNNKEFLDRLYPEIKDYYELPELVKRLIGGVEMTLLRRVVAIGAEVPDINNGANFKWIEVPKQRIKLIESKETITEENA